MKSKNIIIKTILTVVLTYVFIAGNTSGELVLCINTDGHITLEPVNHDHCEEHTHIEQNVLFPLEHEHDRHVDHSHCKPCIDIPIFIGPNDNRLQIKRIKTNLKTFICPITTEVIAHDSFIPTPTLQQAYSFGDENRFLRSVILIV